MMTKEPEDWNLEEANMVSQETARRRQVPIKAWDLVFCSGPTPCVQPREPQGAQHGCLLWSRT